MSNQQISPTIIKSDCGLGHHLRVRLDALIAGIPATSVTYFDNMSFEDMQRIAFCFVGSRLVYALELPQRQYQHLKKQAKALGLEQLKEPA